MVIAKALLDVRRYTCSGRIRRSAKQSSFAALLMCLFLIIPLSAMAQAAQTRGTVQSEEILQSAPVIPPEDMRDSALGSADGKPPFNQDIESVPNNVLTLPESPLVPSASFHNDPLGWIGSLFEQAPREPGLPHDLSPWGMFLAADLVVKGVMLGLAFASLITWTVWLAKTIEIACARARARNTLLAITSSTTLIQATNAVERRGGPVAFMARVAARELAQSERVIDQVGGEGVKERVEVALERINAQAGRRLMRGTGVLATIGSTAPFVGLFGTVWGIMNSFIGISQAQTTNLAVVAPGIAEALLATAIGLVAAIPAVIIYNFFARSITGYRQLLGDATTAVACLLSRDLGLRKAELLEFTQSTHVQDVNAGYVMNNVSSHQSVSGPIAAAE